MSPRILSAPASRVPMGDANPASAVRYLALGDSYTIGEGVAEHERWPSQLVQALGARGYPVSAPEFIAETGWTAAELHYAVMERELVGPYSLVTVQIGVNNQYRGMIVRVFGGQLRRLLDRAIQLAGGADRVVVVSIPDWGVTPFNTRRDPSRVAREIDAYNRQACAVAAQNGVSWVDITDITREHPLAVATDGLHPNANMYARWVERILPAAEAALRAAGVGGASGVARTRRRKG